MVGCLLKIRSCFGTISLYDSGLVVIRQQYPSLLVGSWLDRGLREEQQLAGVPGPAVFHGSSLVLQIFFFLLCIVPQWCCSASWRMW